MNQSMQPAIQRIFQVSTLEAVSREQLEKFVEEYPCFGFGHYLLSRKLRAENADEFQTAALKTSLYFPNPFWLQWMLENTEPDLQEAAPIHLKEPFHSDIPLHSEEPTHSDMPLHSDEPIQDEEPPFVLDETDQPDASASAAELLLESIEKAKALRESIIKINEDFQTHNGQPTTTDLSNPALAPEPAYAEPSPTPEPAYAETEPAAALELAHTEPMPAPEPVSVAPLGDTPAPIAETAPLFEPLHTIDYFASQGIRLSLDENPTDPLGRQLKSFTEWLRSMRRLPQKDREIVPDRAAEQTIQNFAAHSIEGKEPVTETMAEVLAKQGMPERARVVYEKLSLLDPDKSAYFAAKIEQLNIH